MIQDSVLQGMTRDNAYSINYMWGTTGIGVECRQGAKKCWAMMLRSASMDLVLKPENMEKLASNAVCISWMRRSEIIPMVHWQYMPA